MQPVLHNRYIEQIDVFPDLLIIATVRSRVSKILKETFFGTHRTLCKHRLTPLNDVLVYTLCKCAHTHEYAQYLYTVAMVVGLNANRTKCQPDKMPT